MLSQAPRLQFVTFKVSTRRPAASTLTFDSQWTMTHEAASDLRVNDADHRHIRQGAEAMGQAAPTGMARIAG